MFQTLFASAKDVFFIFFLNLLIFSVTAYAQLVVSHESGFYNTTITFSVSSTVGGEIYYSLDGSSPEPGKPGMYVYSKPIIIQKNFANSLMFISTSPLWEKPAGNFPKATVLRVIEVKDKKITDSTGRTYFIGINHTLPVVSIITDPQNLFDEEKGIYVPGKLFDPSNPYWTGNYHQRGDTWERPAVLEYFEGNILKYRTDIGIRIHGEFSRSFPIKSLRLYARN